MSLRKTPPPFTVVHGLHSCENRFLVLGVNVNKSYSLVVMALACDTPEYGGLGRAIRESGSADKLGLVIDTGWMWDFAHRESSCKSK